MIAFFLHRKFRIGAHSWSVVEETDMKDPLDYNRKIGIVAERRCNICGQAEFEWKSPVPMSGQAAGVEPL